jgi:hypothetical protein
VAVLPVTACLYQLQTRSRSQLRDSAGFAPASVEVNFYIVTQGIKFLQAPVWAVKTSFGAGKLK